MARRFSGTLQQPILPLLAGAPRRSQRHPCRKKGPMGTVSVLPRYIKPNTRKTTTMTTMAPMIYRMLYITRSFCPCM